MRLTAVALTLAISIPGSSQGPTNTVRQELSGPIKAHAPIVPPGFTAELKKENQEERTKHESEMNMEFGILIQSLRDWKEIYLGYASWPKDAYMQADRKGDRQLLSLIRKIANFNSSMKKLTPEALTLQQRFQIITLAREVQTGTGELLPGVPPESPNFSRAWAEVSILDILEKIQNATDSQFNKFEQSFMSRHFEEAMNQSKALILSSEYIRDLGDQFLTNAGNPLDGLRATGGRDAVLNTIQRKLASHLSTRNERISNALKAVLDSLTKRQTDIEGLEEHGNGISEQMRRFRLASDIQQNQSRLAQPEATTVIEHLREPIKRSLNEFVIPNPPSSYLGLPANLATFDTVEKCEEGITRAQGRIKLADEYIGLGSDLNDINPIDLEQAEALGLINTTRLHLLIAYQGEQHRAKSIAAESWDFLREVTKRRDAFLAEKLRVERKLEEERLKAEEKLEESAQEIHEIIYKISVLRVISSERRPRLELNEISKLIIESEKEVNNKIRELKSEGVLSNSRFKTILINLINEDEQEVKRIRPYRSRLSIKDQQGLRVMEMRLNLMNGILTRIH